jgi:hypothetical protein
MDWGSAAVTLLPIGELCNFGEGGIGELLAHIPMFVASEKYIDRLQSVVYTAGVSY